MQTEITGDDNNINMKMDIIATFSYVDSISTFKNMIGDEFTGYADDLSKKAKESILARAIRSGKEVDVEIETSADYEDYEDAFMPLRGLSESSENEFADRIQNLLVNYFSLVQDNNATKALSRNIYQMADSVVENGLCLMGYFSSLHLELTLMGEFENPNSPYLASSSYSGYSSSAGS